MDLHSRTNVKENCNGDSDVILDQRWYYYQTKTGAVSKLPHSVRQLIRLFCPVREGLNSILPSSTQCLPVVITAKQNQNRQDSTTYGDWKMASKIDILREASCNKWYWIIEGHPTEGPGSCRKLLEVTLDNGDIKNSKVKVYAEDITPQWTPISEMKYLQLVLRAIIVKKNVENNADEKVDNLILKIDPTEKVHESNGKKGSKNGADQEKVENELEAFLSSSAGSDVVGTNTKKGQGNDDHFYESDDGTRYFKDPLSGKLIHEALAPKEIVRATTKKSEIHNTVSTKTKSSSKKSKNAKFSKRNAKLWIYISGLPIVGVTSEDLQRYFSRVGLIDLDPRTMQPKIKLYRDRSTGDLKGDASVCYAHPESVVLALQVLDNSFWDKDHRIKVQKAHFEAKTEEGTILSKSTLNENEDGSSRDEHIKRRRPISQAQRKVARLAILQAQDEGFGGRLAGGRKGLCIIVVKKVMNGIPEENLEDVLYESFSKFGSIEKITCISKSRVVIVKYIEPIAASSAVQALNGSPNPRTKEKIEAMYWDGVTDYTRDGVDEQKEKEEEERRHKEFGDWLESQEELPPELQLQVAQD